MTQRSATLKVNAVNTLLGKEKAVIADYRRLVEQMEHELTSMKAILGRMEARGKARV